MSQPTVEEVVAITAERDHLLRERADLLAALEEIEANATTRYVREHARAAIAAAHQGEGT